MREMLGLGPLRAVGKVPGGAGEGLRMGTSCLHHTVHTTSHVLKLSSVLSSCCWVGSSLAKPSPSAPAAFGQCFDSLPYLPSHPGTAHSAKNILEDISNMFDDLADQLDAMLD